MLETIIHPLPTLTSTIHSVPIPEPLPNEVLIRVHAAGSNPKDWIHITAFNLNANSGDDIAGTVHALGSSVHDLQKGDRVAAFHRMGKPSGAYAEYAIAPAHTTFHIPEHVSFEEAATIPLVSITSALTLFRRQGLPPPWSPSPAASAPTPLIIYGASSALGLFSVKLAVLSNIHPIIAIGGGSNQEQILPLLDATLGDAFVDYRPGVAAMSTAVHSALKGLQAHHAVDAISANGTWIPLSHMLDPNDSVLSVFSGREKYDDAALAAGVELRYTFVGTAHDGAYLPHMPKQPSDAAEVQGDIAFADRFFKFISQALAERTFHGHPYEVTPGGLAGVEVSLRQLKEGQARGRKFVARIAETPGLTKSS